MFELSNLLRGTEKLMVKQVAKKFRSFYYT